MIKIIRPRGTRDILPNEMEKRKYIENKFRDIIEKWGYKEINTPTFEFLNLFTLKSGNDIIKELYSFNDKNERQLALRPELTAPVMRSYLNEMQFYPKPIKLFYFENCFRYERPQKGRYREFWQFGVEIIGGEGTNAESEMISLAITLLESIGIHGEINIGNLKILKILLNQMNINEEDKKKILHLIDKKEYISLNNFLDSKNITEDIKKKLFELIKISEINPLYSIEKAKEIVGDTEALYEIKDLISKLNLYGFNNIKINFGIVRGLDYYNGTVFEIYDKKLGSQSQICGGGSYNLIKLFGGENINSTGFGIGFDRICEICDLEIPRKKTLFIISNNSTYEKSIEIAKILRKFICVNVDLMNKSFNSQLSYANSINADFVLFLKKDNQNLYYSLKNMNTGKQIDLNLEQLIEKIRYEEK